MVIALIAGVVAGVATQSLGIGLAAGLGWLLLVILMDSGRRQRSNW